MRAVAASIIMPVDAGGTGARRLRLAHGRDDALGLGDLVGGGGEDLVGDRDLARVDRPLADGAERRRPGGVGAVAVEVAEVGVSVRRSRRGGWRGRPRSSGCGRSATCRPDSARADPPTWPALMPWLAERSPTPRMSASRRAEQPAISSTRASASVSSMRISSPMRPGSSPSLASSWPSSVSTNHTSRGALTLGTMITSIAAPAPVTTSIRSSWHHTVSRPLIRTARVLEPQSSWFRAPTIAPRAANLGVGCDGVLEIEEHQVGVARRGLRHHLVAGARCRELGAAQAHRSGHVDLLWLHVRRVISQGCDRRRRGGRHR